MEPISQYREQRYEADILYSLFSDKVSIKGKAYLSSAYEYDVELGLLRNKREIFKQTSGVLHLGYFFLFPSIVAMIIMSGFFNKRLDSDPMIIVWCVMLLGVMTTLLGLKKVEFSVFRYETGQPALAIAKSGWQSDLYEEFVESLQNQISVIKPESNPHKPHSE